MQKQALFRARYSQIVPDPKPSDPPRPNRLESQIEDARRRGLFDDLPGAGRPQANLAQADDPLWWAKELLKREQLSLLPPALEIRKKVEEVLSGLPALNREEEARRALEELNRRIRELNSKAPSGPPTTLAPLDVEEALHRWRSARTGDGPGSPEAPR